MSVLSYVRICNELLKASPSLQRLLLKIYSILRNIDVGTNIYRTRRKARYQHTQLKVVEFVGFRGYTKDVELVECLQAALPGLEKLVIDPHPVSPSDKCGEWDIGKAIYNAQQLRNILSLGAKLVISSEEDNNNFSSEEN
ncbi:hypothetical protein SOVF_173000 [Spinacia oleracea]|nr:hypothetical protein SOVF_173000 [Spinacia oleracea]